MFISKEKKLTKMARYFLEPANSTHRQYEALRAYFVDNLSAEEAAKRFGYTTGSFRVLCHHFRHNPQRQFFCPPPKGPHVPKKKNKVRDKVVALRKKNLSIYDIRDHLKESGVSLSPPAVSKILREEGFAKLPRRRDEERPDQARAEVAEVADVRNLNLEPRSFRTKFGGLFLFLVYLTRLPFDRIMDQAEMPGSAMVPASHAMRSLLALKLYGNARSSHVMSEVLDDGLALFAGLNRIPKRTFLSEYSCRVDPTSYPRLMSLWFDALSSLGLERGGSFDLDFHTIPFHGEDALMEKHYVSKRSRRQKGILAFLAQDAGNRVFCYANADVRKSDQNDEILRFAEFWKDRTGSYPEELIFDSKLTTHGNLNILNQKNIRFMTLRRRTKRVLDAIHKEPISAWRRIELENVTRAYRTPRILDHKITLSDYDGPIRQLAVKDLGHEEPTLLLTNQLRASPAKLISRYARRMIIENNIQDGIDFFHMDALSSAVAMKVNLDLQLTLMASSLYHLLGQDVGRGYEVAKSRHIFRDLVNTPAQVRLSKTKIKVQLTRRAHNPLLIAAGFQGREMRVPWLENRTLNIDFK
jgi:transposase